MGTYSEELPKLSNPFSTGGGGVNFENYVQSYFLFKMLSHDVCPILKMPIKQMDFQAKHLGYDTDDLIISAASGENCAKLLCQIKHDITVSINNETFRSVITAAWNDFQKPLFDQNSDKIALITASTGKKSKHALETLHDFAQYAKSVDEFLSNLHMENHCSNSVRDTFFTIRSCIQPVDDFGTWQFLRCFHLYLFDLDVSNNNSLYDTLLSAIHGHTTQEPELVWARLRLQCGAWNQRGVSITYSDIPASITSLFVSGNSATEIEKYLATLSSLDFISECAPFSYDYSRLTEIWGRELQYMQLKEFADDDSNCFQFCVVTGPAGIGKSKLVFYFGCEYQRKKNWLVRKISPKDIATLSQQKNWNANRDILLIIDYANEQQELITLLRTLSTVNQEPHINKLRIVLIAREGTTSFTSSSNRIVFPEWYKDIKRDHVVHRYLFSGDFMNLKGLSKEDCTALHSEFTANHLHKQVTAEDEKKVLKLIKQTATDEDGYIRPLYALFVMDLYYNCPDDNRHWDLHQMQEQIYLRDGERWTRGLAEASRRYPGLFHALMSLLLYATIFDGWTSDLPLPPPLSEECDILFHAVESSVSDPRSNWFKIITGHEVYSDGIPVLSRLTPDMVGEYFSLSQLAKLNRNSKIRWTTLMANNLPKCKDFFIRAIQDFGSDETFIGLFLDLFTIISDLLADADDQCHHAFSSILETFYKSHNRIVTAPYFTKTTQLLTDYIEKYGNHHIAAAELNLIFHEHRPHMSLDEQKQLFTEIEKLYNKWPNSRKILCRYIGLLGAIVVTEIEISTQDCSEYQDDYTSKFYDLQKWVTLPDDEVKCIFVPVLTELITKSYDKRDWNRAFCLEDQFLRKIMTQYSNELAMDFINHYTSVLTEVIKHRAHARSWSESIHQALDYRLKQGIEFYKSIIEKSPDQSFNFVWTYVTTLPKIAKNLFIYEKPPLDSTFDSLNPISRDFFQYMLCKLKLIYHIYHHSMDGSSMSSHASNSLDLFCDAKSSAIPYSVKEKCILSKQCTSCIYPLKPSECPVFVALHSNTCSKIHCAT